MPTHGTPTETINIMTSCDNNLAKWVAPALTGIAENLRGRKVDFYFFHSRVDGENLNFLKSHAKRFSNIEFREVRIEDDAPYAELASRGGAAWAYEAYYSLECHKYLPESVERILYIDAGDVMILGDIDEYYYGDFRGCSLLAHIARFKSAGNALSAFSKNDLGKSGQHTGHRARFVQFRKLYDQREAIPAR
jgi:lipopolysaccharide biosynthesis glycosyltransferase